jgi:hypothetical protein
VLEIEFLRDGRVVRDRRALDSAALEELRQRVADAVAHEPAVDPNDRSGRPLLLAGTSLLGLAFYDWALPVAADLDGKEAVATGMLAAAGSFFVPWVLTRNGPVTYGMTDLALYGATRGIVHGMAAYELFEQTESPFEVDASDSDKRLAAALVGSVVEGVGGYFWARQTRMTTGKAHTIGATGDFGFLWAGGIAEIADNDDTALDQAEDRGLYAAALAGSAAGFAAGSWIADHRDYTWGDVEVVRVAGLTGATVGAAAADLAGTEDEDWWIASGIAGSAAGLWLGDRLVRETDYPAGLALLVDVGSLAGAALGLGIAYLATSDSNSDSDVYAPAAALGALGGFALTYGPRGGKRKTVAPMPAGTCASIRSQRSRRRVGVIAAA